MGNEKAYKFLVLGWARHGKDTVAEIMRDRHGVSFSSSSYFMAERVVRPGLAQLGIVYDSLDACYADRVNHRALWRDLIAKFNGPEPARLAGEILKVTDCYVGMRTQRELDAARHMFDFVFWVDASGRGIPPEGRDSMDIEFDPSYMIRIDNNGNLDDLEKTVGEVMADVVWSELK